MNHGRLQRIMSGQGRGTSDSLARLGLGLLTPGYRAAIAARNRAFDAGARRPRRLGRPTLSVGNLTTGGTGKTPMVLHLARRLVEMGATPAILTRGYHGGDEADQLRSELGEGVPVEANADRVAGARAVLANHPQTSVFLLDDAFQHRRVHRDGDLVLIDATRPFGYGHLLPRGLLREPAANLRRADAVIVTRTEQATPDRLAELDARIAALTGRPPLAHAAMRWSGWRGPPPTPLPLSGAPRGERLGEGGARDAIDLNPAPDTDSTRPPDALQGRRVYGVSGIGNPAAFERMLRAAVDQVAGVRIFADHHRYTETDWAAIVAAATEAGADALVMTEKDWVKCAPLARATPSLSTYRPELSIEFTAGGDAVDTLLRQIFSKQPTMKEKSDVPGTHGLDQVQGRRR